MFLSIMFLYFFKACLMLGLRSEYSLTLKQPWSSTLLVNICVLYNVT